MRVVIVADRGADQAAILSRELRDRVDVVLVDAARGPAGDPAGRAESKRVIELPGDGGARAVAVAMVALEAVVAELRPDAVVVCGDGVAAPAAALVAVKLGVPQVRVGAGLRSGERGAADEINREVTDRVCGLLLCADETAAENLRREGMEGKAHVVGALGEDPRPAVEAVVAWLEAGRAAR